jgi:signal transduction histidine kinase
MMPSSHPSSDHHLHLWREFSHDIRHQLAIIQAFSMVGANTPDAEKRRGYSDKVRGAAVAISGMVKALEEYLADAAPDPYQLCLTDLADIAEHAVAGAQAVADVEGRNLALTLYAPPTLPVRCDRGGLERVLLNLLNNAIRFTPDGGSISLSLHCDKNEAVILIEDTGVGISAENLGKIFDPLWKTTTPTNSTEGNGLGLAICQRIVANHGGEISVQSAVGHGSLFTVRLPLG